MRTWIGCAPRSRSIASRSERARALALTIASVVAGCLPSAPAGVGRAAIVGGSDDAGDGAVVAIVDRRTRCDDASVRIVCSGTLIAPRVVLTAAHCLAEQGPGATWEVAFGTPIGSDPAGRFFVVTDVAVDPAWSDATHAHDLALMRLSDDAPVAPVPFATAPLPASLVGATVRVVGYGETTPGVAADGVRRRRRCRSRPSTAGPFAPTRRRATARRRLGRLGARRRGQRRTILGVTSSGDAACASYAVQARVDVAVAAFVQPYLDATAAAPSGRPAGVIGESAICQTACASAADCPDGLACLARTLQSTGGVRRHAGAAGELRRDLRARQRLRGCHLRAVVARRCRCLPLRDAVHGRAAAADDDASWLQRRRSRRACAVVGAGRRRRRGGSRAGAATC